MTKSERSGAAEFLDSNVVAAYVHRPDYPAALFDALLALMPRPGRVLDIGRALDGGRHGNIVWTQGVAEDLSLCDQSFELAVSGAAIHWIDCSLLCPKLDRALAPGGVLAIVEGDAPTAAPWLGAYQGVLQDWVERLGGTWNSQAHRAMTTAHLAWLDLEGTQTFRGQIRQTLDELIACQHSRATWSRTRMGRLAEAFDSDLHAALEPWAVDGVMTFEVETRLAWGRPRSR